MEIQQYLQPSQCASYAQPTPLLKEKRIEFAIFIKVLIRCLEYTHQEAILRQTKLIVMACIRGHELGDASYRPLEIAIEERLKRIVDRATWEQAHSYCKYYLSRKQGSRMAQGYDPSSSNGCAYPKEDIEPIPFQVTRIAQI